MPTTHISNEELDKQIALLEKTRIPRDDAQRQYAEKKLPEGKIFFIQGAGILVPGESKEREGWAAGVFVCGKFLYAIFSASDRRLPRLKRQAVRKLMAIVETKMVDTRQSTMLPPRFQSLKDPSFVLHGAHSQDTDINSPTVKKEQQVFEEADVSWKEKKRDDIAAAFKDVPGAENLPIIGQGA